MRTLEAPGAWPVLPNVRGPAASAVRGNVEGGGVPAHRKAPHPHPPSSGGPHRDLPAPLRPCRNSWVERRPPWGEGYSPPKRWSRGPGKGSSQTPGSKASPCRGAPPPGDVHPREMPRSGVADSDPPQIQAVGWRPRREPSPHQLGDPRRWAR